MSHGRGRVPADPQRRRLLAGGAALAASALFAPGAARAELSDEDRADIARVEGYLNGIGSLSAAFIQLGPAGELSRGRFYLRRPGRLRFEYEPPTPLLIVADGLWVVLYDSELGQVSRFPLAETPLAVLAAKDVDLSDGLEVSHIERQLGILRMRIIDTSRPDDGWLMLTFSEPPLALRQWHVRDAQGGVTVVSLVDLATNVELDPELFVFTDPAPFKR